MIKTLTEKVKLITATRDKCEELAMTMEFLKAGTIKPLKVALKKYSEDYENNQSRERVDKIVMQLIQLADRNRKEEGILN